MTWILPFLLAPLVEMRDYSRARKVALTVGVVPLFVPVTTLFWWGSVPAVVTGLPLRQTGLVLVLLSVLYRAGVVHGLAGVSERRLA